MDTDTNDPSTSGYSGIIDSDFDTHESKAERAARIRQNQRRCRERKLAYVASLEDRLRAYDQRCVNANVQLQRQAQKLSAENRKIKRILAKVFSVGDENTEEMDCDDLIQKINSLKDRSSNITDHSERASLSKTLSITSNLASQSLHTVQNETQTGDGRLATNHDSVLAITATDCQTIPCKICIRGQELGSQNIFSRSVCCEATFELLKYLIDQQYPMALENAGYELKDGVLVGIDGCCVDAGMLGKLLMRSDRTSVDR